MRLPFFTVGHSNRSLEEFVELLRSAEIELLADIRKFPRSRTNPQFNQETLAEELPRCGISYELMGVLGGRRGTVKSVPPDVNGLWRNVSFHNYADYALSAEFSAGLRHLLDMGHERRCATMCSEAVWWRCHRRIVTDYLIASGETVFHIMGLGRFERARLTQGAVVREDGKVVYPWGLTGED
ncbi:MAG TPA: DUF488 domain-containing protein [Acidobacteriaceae bacterium]|nr:DUF488 domain-containing protein [Acidobacteriaceae bacterium]